MACRRFYFISTTIWTPVAKIKEILLVLWFARTEVIADQVKPMYNSLAG